MNPKFFSKFRLFLPQIIFGGIDGLVTTFAVVAGAAGASLSVQTIIILGFANLVADGFSMSVGSFLSKQTEMDMAKLDNQNLPFFEGLATFLSFNIIGLIPLLAFILPFTSNYSNNSKFIISAILTLIAFVVIGYFKSKVSNKSMLKGIGETVLLGGIAASLAFFAGNVLESIV